MYRECWPCILVSVRNIFFKKKCTSYENSISIWLNLANFCQTSECSSCNNFINDIKTRKWLLNWFPRHKHWIARRLIVWIDWISMDYRFHVSLQFLNTVFACLPFLNLEVVMLCRICIFELHVYISFTSYYSRCVMSLQLSWTKYPWSCLRTEVCAGNMYLDVIYHVNCSFSNNNMCLIYISRLLMMTRHALQVHNYSHYLGRR